MELCLKEKNHVFNANTHSYCNNTSRNTKRASSNIQTTFIYPTNNASIGILKNKRYVMENPFPGYMIKCIAQIFCKNHWSQTTWQKHHTDLEVAVTHLLPEDSILMQINNIASENLFQHNKRILNERRNPLLCRIYVEKGCEIAK